MNPIHSSGRTPDDGFERDERLYRRFDPNRFLIDGILSPLAFSFPRQSVNRGKYSAPEDVLHPDCCGSTVLTGWRIAMLLVGDVPRHLKSGDGREFLFFLRHAPLTSCYAHSEMRCNSGGRNIEASEEPRHLRRSAKSSGSQSPAEHGREILRGCHPDGIVGNNRRSHWHKLATPIDGSQ